MSDHFNHAIINFMHIQPTNLTLHNPDPSTPPTPNLPIKLIIAEIKNKQKNMHIFFTSTVQLDQMKKESKDMKSMKQEI